MKTRYRVREVMDALDDGSDVEATDVEDAALEFVRNNEQKNADYYVASGEGTRQVLVLEMDGCSRRASMIEVGGVQEPTYTVVKRP